MYLSLNMGINMEGNQEGESVGEQEDALNSHTEKQTRPLRT